MIYFYHVYYSIIMSKRRGVLAGTQKIKKTSETYLCIYVHRGVGNYTRNIENLLRFAHGMFLFVFPVCPRLMFAAFPRAKLPNS